MVSPNPKQQKAALQELQNTFNEPSMVSAIHYSCESFYNRPQGISPRITSIAVCNLATQQAESFSIHRTAEREQVSFEEIKNHYDKLESTMLSDFFDHLSQNSERKFLHWNMRDENYGFQAITHRMRVIGGTEKNVYRVPESQKIDLARLLKDIYGPTYIGDPRMQMLQEKNQMKPLNFLTGQGEADAFDAQQYHLLHLSSLAKAHSMTEIARLANNRQLKTNTRAWQMHGGRARATANLLFHRVAVGCYGIAGTISGIVFD